MLDIYPIIIFLCDKWQMFSFYIRATTSSLCSCPDNKNGENNGPGQNFVPGPKNNEEKSVKSVKKLHPYFSA